MMGAMEQQMMAMDGMEQGGGMGSGGGGSMMMSSTSFSMGPGGVTEVKRHVRDGSGREEVMMERRIGDRARRVTRQRMAGGDEETEDNSVNITDEEQFDREFKNLQ
eukprot:CAMPEP_0173426054 /NCGR_PEP_ID=MMETSP1357-20121228/5618_1 /TAXON_ID=77926 /ORGANISM="Hemiselmis rufescens, Strain PCC563" /LENGTH=105 /DNA_ID=CAMNT_0014389625 /DNA_START=15 /DNA_END=329 /DNA_ORIENTATION=+